MKNKDCVRLKHMLDATESILMFLHKRNRTELDTNQLLLSGVIHQFQVLGEAANQVSQTTQKLFPMPPWKKLIGMRNRLIHAYFDVDTAIIWETVQNHLPAFAKQLRGIVSLLEA